MKHAVFANWVAMTIILLHVTEGKEVGCVATLERFRAIVAKSSRILSIGYGALSAGVISTRFHIVDLNPSGVRATADLGPVPFFLNFFVSRGYPLWLPPSGKRDCYQEFMRITFCVRKFRATGVVLF